MTVASTTPGVIVFGVVLAVFIVQEFTRGFEAPADGEVRDERRALLYLEVLPVVLVTLAAISSLLGWSAWPASGTVFAIGIVVFIAGIAIREWSHRTLGRFHQVVVTIRADHEIITSGPYRHVRHPMYAGSAVAFLGIGLALGTWAGLLLAFVGTLPAIVRRISVEEGALQQALPGRYAEYAAGRARLVPGLW